MHRYTVSLLYERLIVAEYKEKGNFIFAKLSNAYR